MRPEVRRHRRICICVFSGNSSTSSATATATAATRNAPHCPGLPQQRAFFLLLLRSMARYRGWAKRSTHTPPKGTPAYCSNAAGVGGTFWRRSRRRSHAAYSVVDGRPLAGSSALSLRAPGEYLGKVACCVFCASCTECMIRSFLGSRMYVWTLNLAPGPTMHRFAVLRAFRC